MKLINKVQVAAGLLLLATQASAITVPGTIRVGYNCSGATCSTVQVMSLETYVKRGLNDEWVISWHQESLRAGAVAYRSYGAYHVKNPRASNYDICNNTYCQVNDTDTATATDIAADATAGMVLSRDGVNIFRSEYSSQNNSWDNPSDGLSCTNTDLSCGNGNAGSPATGWPCLADSVGLNKGCFGHGRGMSQWGTQYWAANHGRDWRWITNHYFNNSNRPAGNRSAFIHGPTPSGPTRGTIVGQNNLCLDVAGAATADGTRIIVFNCNGHTAQQWYTSTAREIKNPLAHKCMVLQNGQATEGAQIWEWGCGGQADQKWHLRNMAVVGAASNKCLDVPDGNWVNGAKLRMWSCNGSPAQRFTFDSATRTLRGPNNMCVDLPGGNTTSGTQLQLWTCNGATAQQWNPGNGGFRSAVNTSRCMDVKGNGTADGTPVHLWECRANEPAQQFGLRGQIENNLGKCLDIPGGNAVPGQATQLFTCNGQIPQRWTMWMPN